MSERTERLVTVLAFIAAGVALAFGGFDTLAAAAIGTAGGYSMPRVPPAAAMGVGLAAALAVTLSGCAPTKTLTALELARKVGCHVVCPECREASP